MYDLRGEDSSFIFSELSETDLQKPCGHNCMMGDKGFCCLCKKNSSWTFCDSGKYFYSSSARRLCCKHNLICMKECNKWCSLFAYCCLSAKEEAKFLYVCCILVVPSLVSSMFNSSVKAYEEQGALSFNYLLDIFLNCHSILMQTGSVHMECTVYGLFTHCTWSLTHHTTQVHVVGCVCVCVCVSDGWNLWHTRHLECQHCCSFVGGSASLSVRQVSTI